MSELKTEIPGFYKATTGVLINKDADALSKYKKEKNNLKKLKYMEKDLADLKENILEIKELLKGLVK